MMNEKAPHNYAAVLVETLRSHDIPADQWPRWKIEKVSDDMQAGRCEIDVLLATEQPVLHSRVLVICYEGRTDAHDIIASLRKTDDPVSLALEHMKQYFNVSPVREQVSIDPDHSFELKHPKSELPDYIEKIRVKIQQ